MSARQTSAQLAVLAVIAVGVVMRFVTASPLWLDEALSVHIAGGEEDLGDALRRDGHPGLYYLLLGWWLQLFGEGDGAARALSGLLGVATLPVLWGAARRHGRDVAVATVCLAASSPYLIRYSTEVRMYALVVMTVALGWLAVERAWERPSAGRLGAVAVTTATLVHTHYWTFYVIAAGAVIVAWAGWRQRRVTPAMRIIGAAAAGAATFVFWLDVFFDQLRSTGTPWATRARPTEVFIETLQGLGGNFRFEGETLGVVLAFFAVLGTFAVGMARHDTIEIRSSIARPAPVPAAAALLGLGLGAASAIVTGGAFEARYAAIALPFLLLLAGRGIAVIGRRPRVMAGALIVSLGFAISIDEARRTRSQGEEVAAAIDVMVEPQDVIVFCPDQVGPATIRYLAADNERRAFPSGDGRTVDWRDYLDRAGSLDPSAFALAASDAAGAGAVWFVSGVGYRGLDQPCGVLNGQLDALRPRMLVVGLRELFEGMYAIRYGQP